MADRAVLPVTGIEMHVVSQRHQLVEYAPHDPAVIAARQVRPADALAEQRVARQQQFLLGIV